MFISPEHEKSNYGECSPGPGTAKQKSAFGRQEASLKKSSPGWGFGTQKVSECLINAIVCTLWSQCTACSKLKNMLPSVCKLGNLKVLLNFFHQHALLPNLSKFDSTMH